jgi:hypothetical protein
MKQRERDHWIVIVSLLVLYLAVALLWTEARLTDEEESTLLEWAQVFNFEVG